MYVNASFDEQVRLVPHLNKIDFEKVCQAHQEYHIIVIINHRVFNKFSVYSFSPLLVLYEGTNTNV